MCIVLAHKDLLCPQFMLNFLSIVIVSNELELAIVPHTNTHTYHLTFHFVKFNEFPSAKSIQTVLSSTLLILHHLFFRNVHYLRQPAHAMHAAITCVQNWKLSEALGGRISTQTLGILHVVN